MIEFIIFAALGLWFVLFLAIPTEPRGPSIAGPRPGPIARLLSALSLAGLAVTLVYLLFYF